MPIKVILNVDGEQHSYSQRESLILGRAEDCSIIVKEPEKTISRYHCLIDIAPPTVMVRDFGSLNGTFLNGEKIGQRDKDMSAEEGRKQEYRLIPMKSGDKLQLAKACEISLEVVMPQYCADCYNEIDQPGYTDADNQPVCSDCHAKAEEQRKKEEEAKRAEKEAERKRREAEERAREEAARERAAKEEAERQDAIKKCEEAKRQAALEKEKAEREAALIRQLEEARKAEEERIAAEKAKRNHRRCEICGADLSGVGANEPNICITCRKNPVKVIHFLMQQAVKGRDDVKEIAGYRNIKELGRGGMGAVWLVEEEKTGKEMALKLMLQGASADKTSKDLFLREAYLTGQLNHENVVRQYKCGQSGDAYFILMELCRGGSLDKRIEAKGGKLDIDMATHIILQVLDGLDYAHHAKVAATLKNGKTVSTNGIVHRDFKPGNIFLSDDSSRPVAKVADFGLAKTFDTAGMSGMTGEGMYAGTPVFMPRQQIINFKYSKPDVDVWAAAASYYFMLTGQLAKDFSRGADVASVVLTSGAVPILKRNPRIPKRLAEVIDTALVDNPKIGIQSALELKKAIKSAL